MIHNESSLNDVAPHPENHDDTFHNMCEVVIGGTKRGKDKLADSLGYTRNQRKSKFECAVNLECTDAPSTLKPSDAMSQLKSMAIK